MRTIAHTAALTLTGTYDLTPTRTDILHTYIIHTHFGRVLNSCARSRVWPPSTATNKHLFFSHFNIKVLYNTLRKTVMKTGHCTSSSYVMMLWPCMQMDAGVSMGDTVSTLTTDSPEKGAPGPAWSGVPWRHSSLRCAPHTSAYSCISWHTSSWYHSSARCRPGDVSPGQPMIREKEKVAEGHRRVYPLAWHRALSFSGIETLI